MFVSCDCRDFDLWVRLLDVAPDGTAFNLMSPGLDVLRASYRDMSKGRQWLEPGHVYELTLPNLITSNVFLKGHRMRVQVFGSFAPNFSRNLQTGKSEASSAEMKKARIRVYHGGYASVGDCTSRGASPERVAPARYNLAASHFRGGPLFKLRLACFPVLFLACLSSFAQREPVLKQIDLPHSYYYREMYLPQVTTGPSSAAWSPDSKSLVYSMAGSLWRQELGSPKAEQLTAGPGYDYQPDWSVDGRWVVFDRYDHDAVELWALDLRDGRAVQLTSGGAVNVEPRFSSRWQEDRVCLDFLQGTLPHLHRPIRRR